MMKSLKKNLKYQTIYQILTVVTPLITSPYLSRTLGVESLGIYSYTQSIVNYFMIFAMLGFINYGTRTIAMESSYANKKVVFNEIYAVQVVFCILSIVSYFFFSMIYDYNTKYLMLQSFWLFSCLFDVSWYFFGNEEYKTTVVRSIIIKILTVAAILLFIHSHSDTAIYIFIMSFGTLISQFILWTIVFKNKLLTKVNLYVAFKKHLRPVIILFIPYVAMSVYHILDKTMLGALSDARQSGLYYNSDKLVNIPLSVINGIGIVMLSRISLLQNNKDSKNKIFKLLSLSITAIVLVGSAITFGLAAVAKDFIPIFFGVGYEECINIVSIFSSVIIFKAISNLLVTQYFIPFKKEKYQTICVLFGVIINVILNYILIKSFNMGALGVTIATIITEFLVMTCEIIYVNSKIKIVFQIVKALPFMVIGLIMLFVVRYVAIIRVGVVLKLFLEVCCGGIVYIVLSLLYLKLIDNDLYGYILNIIKKS